MMEIIKEYTAGFTCGDTEKIIIAKYTNGKFYNNYGWMEDHKQGYAIAGGYDSLDEAEKNVDEASPDSKKNLRRKIS